MSLSVSQVRLVALRVVNKVYSRTLKGTSFGRRLAGWVVASGLVSRQEVSLARAGGSLRAKRSRSVTESAEYQPPVGLLPWFDPLNLRVDPALSVAPRLNVLLPSLSMREMSGGPNTALILCARLAARGIRIRLISVNRSSDKDPEKLRQHILRISSEPDIADRLEIADGSNRRAPLAVGAYDVFMATAWWTAQMAKYATRLTRHEQFVYLIQDFEPLLHAASTSYALALETYGLPHVPVVNTRVLLDYLVEHRIGRFADRAFAASALAFEPAVDRSSFFPPSTPGPTPRDGVRRHRLLFYARPTLAERNLFELGLAALDRLAETGRLPADRWELLAMGEPMRTVRLAGGAVLKPMPWLGFEAYARTVREADILLSLMLSPHPSYPPLEMAASGKLVVTNSFSVKTSERLSAISPNILVAEPTVEGVIAALDEALARAESGRFDPTADLVLPRDWRESFREVIPSLHARLDEMWRMPARQFSRLPAPALYGGGGEYEQFLAARLEQRRATPRGQVPGLLSFITTVWNTPWRYLSELAASLLNQDGGTQFEWVILDNGTTDAETRDLLLQLEGQPWVALSRVDQNVGIVPGMRLCLERARGRYVLPLDSDDVLATDCVLTITHAIVSGDYPTVLYTDEDKVDGEQALLPYFKPDWDPVLFVNSCYIAHLCAFDRARALTLGVYSEREAEGCHDWDTYLRFLMAGDKPLHVQDVLYSWRVHQLSTSLNIAAKTWVYESHRKVLQRFIDAQRRSELFEIVQSPLFDGTPDWWIRRRCVEPVPIATIAIGDNVTGLKRAGLKDGCVEVALAWGAGLEKLAGAVWGLDPTIRYVHLHDVGGEIADDDWYWEGIGLFELWPECAVIGGLVHNGSEVLADGFVFGYEDSHESPHAGRLLADPGYFAQLRKQRSVSAVSVAHCLVEHGFLVEALESLRGSWATLATLGLWLGGMAARRSRRVIFTPFFRVRTTQAPESSAGSMARAVFRAEFRDLIPDTRVYSPHLGLDRSSAYVAVSATRREQALARAVGGSTYAEWLTEEVKCRPLRYPQGTSVVRFSAMTTVYSGTPVDLFGELAKTVLNQTHGSFEWIIVAHGPVAPALNDLLARIAEDHRVKLVRQGEGLCITAALRIGLAYAHGDYIVPIDADDCLTGDALSILGWHAERNARPHFLFSDEDLLVNGALCSPFLRPGFDRVLNLESSYIWHLCAIRSDVVQELGLYTDDGATWCHDWDTMFRLCDAGAAIVHVPEVLYHWRHHSGSTSNRSGGSEHSLESVRHVLEGRRARHPYPDRFEVRRYPVDRGASELYLARREVDPVPMVVLHPARARVGVPAAEMPWTFEPVTFDIGRRVLSLDAESIVGLVAFEGSVQLAPCYWEILRLLALHPTVACVSGCIADEQGIVVDGCWVRDRGRFLNPWLGRAVADPGEYALAGKAHVVDAPCVRLAFVRADVLQRVVGGHPRVGSIAELVDTFTCAHRGVEGWVAFSPLVTCQVAKGMSVAPQPPTAAPGGMVADGRHGLARFLVARQLFR